MPPAMSPAESRRSLLAQLTPIVTGIGYDVDDVTVQLVGRRSVVRLVVDGDDGIDLDAIADVSRAVSAVLDDDARAGALFAGSYVLEVSSPGVERPLTEQRHWRRAAGRLVRVTAGGAELTGRIARVDADGVALVVDNAIRTLAWPELGPGRVQVEFSRKGDVRTSGESAEEE